MHYSKEETLKVDWYRRMVVFHHYRWLLRLLRFVLYLVIWFVLFQIYGSARDSNIVMLTLLLMVTSPGVVLIFKTNKQFKNAIKMIGLSYQQQDFQHYLRARESLFKGFKYLGFSALATIVIAFVIAGLLIILLGNLNFNFNLNIPPISIFSR